MKIHTARSLHLPLVAGALLLLAVTVTLVASNPIREHTHDITIVCPPCPPNCLTNDGPAGEPVSAQNTVPGGQFDAVESCFYFDENGELRNGQKIVTYQTKTTTITKTSTFVRICVIDPNSPCVCMETSYDCQIIETDVITYDEEVGSTACAAYVV